MEQFINKLFSKIPTSIQQVTNYDFQPIIARTAYHADRSAHAVVVVVIALLLTGDLTLQSLFEPVKWALESLLNLLPSADV